MKALVIQHEESTPPGSLLLWLKARSIQFEIINFQQSLKAESYSYDFLIILGGGMNVDEEEIYPWLKNEKKFIADCLNKNEKILGICLGAQLISELLGARVFKAEQPEIGWHSVYLDELDRSLYFFHWHYYQFELPVGAKRIASSDICPNQGYKLHENILAIQFHPEADEAWVEECSNDSKLPIESNKFVQNKADTLDGKKYLDESKNWFFNQLDIFFLK